MKMKNKLKLLDIRNDLILKKAENYEHKEVVLHIVEELAVELWNKYNHVLNKKKLAKR